MAIYGDGKHNENMEHVEPQFKVADRRVYKTISWHITDEDEFRDDTYYVTCQEGDVEDIWTIDSDEDGEVDVNSWLGKKLIALCEKYEEDDMGVVFGGE